MMAKFGTYLIKIPDFKYIFNVNDYLIRKELYHVKDNVPIYHLTEFI